VRMNGTRMNCHAFLAQGQRKPHNVAADPREVEDRSMAYIYQAVAERKAGPSGGGSGSEVIGFLNLSIPGVLFCEISVQI
jgi:hypothetical protein